MAVADVNALASRATLRHQYFLIRHGQSVPNVAGRIVSSLEEGRKPENGLTARGREQAQTAAQDLLERLKIPPLFDGEERPRIEILTSDFSRAWETANIVHEGLTDLGATLQVEPSLRERSFGTWDGHPDTNYEQTWRVDKSDPFHKQGGVESCADVQARTTALVARLDDAPSPAPTVYVLVSHGDALQILQTGFLQIDPGQHRSVPHMTNCEVRRVTLGSAP